MKTLAGLCFVGLMFVMCSQNAYANPDIKSAVRAAGYDYLRSVQADLDGDKQPEAIVAGRGEDGAVLSVWRLEIKKDKAKYWRQIYRGRSFDGDIILHLRAQQLVANAAPEVIFEVREESPDETSRHLVVYRWFNKALVSIFDSNFSVEELYSKKSGEQLLSFGETSAGYRFFDDDGDGQQEIAVRRDLKIVRSKRTRKAALRVVVGARETIFRFQARGRGAGEYVAGREQFHPYVEEVPVAKTSGSSQWLPPELETRFGRQAVAEGVDEIFTKAKEPGIEFSLSDIDAHDAGSGDATNPDDDKPALKRDPAPKAIWAADGDLQTCWCEGVKGQGIDEWWQADFASEHSFRMMRLILGDVSSRKNFNNSNRVRGINLSFSSGERVYFDRDDLDFTGGELAGFADYPLGGGRAGQQTLVFFDHPIKASWVRVEILQASSRGRDDKTCITELKFYATAP